MLQQCTPNTQAVQDLANRDPPLIQKWSNPIKVRLTPEGTELGKRLFAIAVSQGDVDPLPGVDHNAVLRADSGAVDTSAATPDEAAQAPAAPASKAPRKAPAKRAAAGSAAAGSDAHMALEGGAAADAADQGPAAVRPRAAVPEGALARACVAASESAAAAPVRPKAGARQAQAALARPKGARAGAAAAPCRGKAAKRALPEDLDVAWRGPRKQAAAPLPAGLPDFDSDEEMAPPPISGRRGRYSAVAPRSCGGVVAVDDEDPPGVSDASAGGRVPAFTSSYAKGYACSAGPASQRQGAGSATAAQPRQPLRAADLNLGALRRKEKPAAAALDTVAARPPCVHTAADMDTAVELLSPEGAPAGRQGGGLSGAEGGGRSTRRGGALGSPPSPRAHAGFCMGPQPPAARSSPAFAYAPLSPPSPTRPPPTGVAVAAVTQRLVGDAAQDQVGGGNAGGRVQPSGSQSVEVIDLISSDEDDEENGGCSAAVAAHKGGAATASTPAVHAAGQREVAVGVGRELQPRPDAAADGEHASGGGRPGKADSGAALIVATTPSTAHPAPPHTETPPAGAPGTVSGRMRELPHVRGPPGSAGAAPLAAHTPAVVDGGTPHVHGFGGSSFEQEPPLSGSSGGLRRLQAAAAAWQDACAPTPGTVSSISGVSGGRPAAAARQSGSVGLALGGVDGYASGGRGSAGCIMSGAGGVGDPPPAKRLASGVASNTVTLPRLKPAVPQQSGPGAASAPPRSAAQAGAACGASAAQSAPAGSPAARLQRHTAARGAAVAAVPGPRVPPAPHAATAPAGDRNWVSAAIGPPLPVLLRSPDVRCVLLGTPRESLSPPAAHIREYLLSSCLRSDAVVQPRVARSCLEAVRVSTVLWTVVCMYVCMYDLSCIYNDIGTSDNRDRLGQNRSVGTKEWGSNR